MINLAELVSAASDKCEDLNKWINEIEEDEKIITLMIFKENTTEQKNVSIKSGETCFCRSQTIIFQDFSNIYRPKLFKLLIFAVTNDPNPRYKKTAS